MSTLKQTKYVQFVSGPGAGKTTTSVLMFGEMKIEGYNAEYVQEYAKSLVWKGELELLNNQHHVSQEQYRLFKGLQGSVDWVVTDGSLLHGLYYNRHNPANISNVEKTEEAILKFFHDLDNIVIFLERDDFEYETAGRLQSYEQAREIDESLKSILKYHKIPFVCFRSRKQSIPGMIDYVTRNF